jgi:hypothetical protein
MSRAEFECVCGHIFETWAERTPTFTVECRPCGRLLRPQRFIGEEAATDEDDYCDADDDNEDDHEDGDAVVSRAEFECACGNTFETWAARTSTFTVECRSCGRSLRPTRFVGEETDTDDDYNAIDDEDAEAESDEAELPLYGVARFNCDCGHGFTSYAMRAPDFYCRCYRCGSHVRPAEFLPKDKVLKKRNSTETHSCSVCNGSGNCPVVGASGGGGASRRRSAGWSW